MPAKPPAPAIGNHLKKLQATMSCPPARKGLVHLASVDSGTLTSRATTSGTEDTSQNLPRPTFIAMLPTLWTPMTPNVAYQQVEIQRSDADYHDASSFFVLNDTTLHHIYRIQNPSLFTQFLAEKSKMQQVYHQSCSEQLALNELLLLTARRVRTSMRSTQAASIGATRA